MARNLILYLWMEFKIKLSVADSILLLCFSLVLSLQKCYSITTFQTFYFSYLGVRQIFPMFDEFHMERRDAYDCFTSFYSVILILLMLKYKLQTNHKIKQQDILTQQRAEVLGVLLSTFNKELYEKGLKDNAYNEGFAERTKKILSEQIQKKLAKGKSVELIADELEISVETAKEYISQIK